MQRANRLPEIKLIEDGQIGASDSTRIEIPALCIDSGPYFGGHFQLANFKGSSFPPPNLPILLFSDLRLTDVCEEKRNADSVGFYPDPTSD